LTINSDVSLTAGDIISVVYYREDQYQNTIDGVETTFQVDHFPIVEGVGSSIATSLTDSITVYVDGYIVDVDSVDGINGTFTLVSAPASGSTIRVVYYYNSVTAALYAIDPSLADQVENQDSCPNFIRDHIEAVVLEPFIRQEGKMFVLGESIMGGGTAYGDDQMAGTHLSFEQWGTSYTLTGGTYDAEAAGTVLPSADVPLWSFNGSGEGGAASQIVSTSEYSAVSQVVAGAGDAAYYERSEVLSNEFLFEARLGVSGSNGTFVADTLGTGIEIQWSNNFNRVRFFVADDGFYVSTAANPTGQQVTPITVTDTFYNVLISGDDTSFSLYLNGVPMLVDEAPETFGAPASNFYRFGRINSVANSTSILWDYARYKNAEDGSVDTRSPLGETS
jgi:hypothetical protein